MSEKPKPETYENMSNITYFKLSMLKADSSDSTGMKAILERDELDDGGSKCCDILITAMMKKSYGARQNAHKYQFSLKYTPEFLCSLFLSLLCE